MSKCIDFQIEIEGFETALAVFAWLLVDLWNAKQTLYVPYIYDYLFA